MWLPVCPGTALLPSLKSQARDAVLLKCSHIGAPCPEVCDLHCPDTVKQPFPLPCTASPCFPAQLFPPQHLSKSVIVHSSICFCSDVLWIRLLPLRYRQRDGISHARDLQETTPVRKNRKELRESEKLSELDATWLRINDRGKERKEGWNISGCCGDLKELEKSVVESLTKMFH